MTVPGIPADWLEHERKGTAARGFDQWRVGPFRLRQVAMTKREPWLADLGGGATATGADPREAMERALQRLRDEIDVAVSRQESAETTMEMLP